MCKFSLIFIKKTMLINFSFVHMSFPRCVKNPKIKCECTCLRQEKLFFISLLVTAFIIDFFPISSSLRYQQETQLFHIVLANFFFQFIPSTLSAVKDFLSQNWKTLTPPTPPDEHHTINCGSCKRYTIFIFPSLKSHRMNEREKNHVRIRFESSHAEVHKWKITKITHTQKTRAST